VKVSIKKQQHTNFFTFSFCTYLIALILWFITVGFVLNAIWNHLNYLQIDHAGHIASAGNFYVTKLHQFNDRFFLGYISNLFYPPLEDMILSGLGFCTFGNMITAYQTYLSILFIGYFLSFFSFSLALKSYLSKTFFLSCTLFLMWIAKDSLLHYQGLSILDLMVTGLCSQFLGAIFFILMLKELVQKNRSLWITALLFLTITSHIVMGLVAILMLGIIILTSKKEDQKNSILSLATALGLASFFLFPFIVYKSYITSSSILLTQPYLFFCMGLVGAVIFFRAQKHLPFFLSAAIILAPLVFGPQLDAWGIHLPIFHYYRFGIIALLLLSIGFALILDSEYSKYKKVIPFGFVILLFSTFHLQEMNFNSPEYQAPFFDWTNYKSSSASFGRDWVIENDRSFGFGIDSILSLRDPNFKSNKGLFWESSKSNTLLTSYFATLFSPPVVLDYFYYYGYSCEIQRCLMDNFFQDYNIERIIVSNQAKFRSAKPERIACFREIFRSKKTKQYNLNANGSFLINSEQFDIYDLQSSSHSNKVANYIDSQQFKSYTPEKTSAYEATLRDRYESCKNNSSETSLFFEPLILEKMKAVSSESLPDSNALAEIPFKEISPGSFEINADANQNRWIWIKLAELPGVKITNVKGEIVPHFQAFPGMITYGKGKLLITYSRPFAAYIGYLISIITLLICTILAWRPYLFKKTAFFLIPFNRTK